MSMRRLGRPRAANVRDRDGVPQTLGARAVEAIVEDWVVEDRWWTGQPLRRRYFELVLDDGVNAVVFHDLERRRWYTQRG